MSIIQQHTAASLSDAWRTIDIDALVEDSSVNFDTSTLHPPQPETSEAEVRQINGQVRQLLRGGDAEGALRGALETPVYNGPDAAKDAHLHTVIEVLQSIKASDMTPMLQRIYATPGGSECLDVLMKYLYKGMAATTTASGSGDSSAPRTPTSGVRGGMTPQQTGFSQVGARAGASSDSTGAAMSVLLSWHEKVVDVAGMGCIGRCMTDWRKV
ncbi:actin-related protein 2/3 complex subunit 5 [Bombardia bombarda]|uniref:Actin-related protein 2/3 complex subunit 5 n=1 Tax=Bombardia bombarda TaxID=252184 RepID=A0AA39XJ00_9PEZI|nr:actin-related protein 2/3 complex subunit 5 [Bombardia bombarda]